MAEAFSLQVKKQAADGKLPSREHFSLDGTLVEAAASLKSFRRNEETRKEGPGKDLHGGDGDPIPTAPEKQAATATPVWIPTASVAETPPTPPAPTRRRCLPNIRPARPLALPMPGIS